MSIKIILMGYVWILNYSWNTRWLFLHKLKPASATISPWCALSSMLLSPLDWTTGIHFRISQGTSDTAYGSLLAKLSQIEENYTSAPKISLASYLFPCAIKMSLLSYKGMCTLHLGASLPARVHRLVLVGLTLALHSSCVDIAAQAGTLALKPVGCVECAWGAGLESLA